jgi:hypothetical protein
MTGEYVCCSIEQTLRKQRKSESESYYQLQWEFTPGMFQLQFGFIVIAGQFERTNRTIIPRP